MAAPKKPIIALVDPAVRAELERRAKDADRTLSAEIRRALREHLEASPGISSPLGAEGAAVATAPSVASVEER
jgi:hypothetical protein